MGNDTNTLNIILAVSVIVLLFGVVFAGTNQGFSLFQEQVFVPQYFTGECVARADNLQEIQVASHTDDPTFYHCDTQEAGKWVPNVPGVQCEYNVVGELQSVHICEGFTENENDIPGIFSGGSPECSDDVSNLGSEHEFSVEAGDTIYINSAAPFGDAELTVKYPSFGLRLRSADGFVQSTSNDCLLNSLPQQFHTTGAGDRLEIIPDVPFNAVSALQPAISTQAVRLIDVQNGEPIYISRPGFYHLIEQADDGFLFVDTTKEFSSTNIQCIPRTTGCSDEAKIVQIEEQSCDEFGGSITNFAPVANDPTQLCKYSCTDGSLALTNDCIQVQPSCPPETPLWDTTTGECTRTIEEQRCPDGLPIGDRALVVKDTKSCGDSLLCKLDITEPEVVTETQCVQPSFFDEFGLLLVTILGAIGLVVSLVIRQNKKKKRK